MNTNDSTFELKNTYMRGVRFAGQNKNTDGIDSWIQQVEQANPFDICLPRPPPLITPV